MSTYYPTNSTAKFAAIFSLHFCSPDFNPLKDDGDMNSKKKWKISQWNSSRYTLGTHCVYRYQPSCMRLLFILLHNCVVQKCMDIFFIIFFFICNHSEIGSRRTDSIKRRFITKNIIDLLFVRMSPLRIMYANIRFGN